MRRLLGADSLRPNNRCSLDTAPHCGAGEPARCGASSAPTRFARTIGARSTRRRTAAPANPLDAAPRRRYAGLCVRKFAVLPRIRSHRRPSRRTAAVQNLAPGGDRAPRLEQNGAMGSFVPSPRVSARVPDLVPVLSRGRHRSPRKGACFMELASFMAGERWSDHPACTHPLLAALACQVNDATRDAARHLLAPLIPDVVGLTSDDPRVDVRIALRSATAALPVAAVERQRVMAVAVVAAHRLLDELDDPGRVPTRRRAGDRPGGPAHVPDAARWADEFADRCPPGIDGFRRHGAPSIVRQAVDGIAKACIPDPDRALRNLLCTAIGECADWIRGDGDVPVEAATPAN